MGRSPLSDFGVDNFKAFQSRQVVPLRPITLLFGRNNCGKSALLRSLVLGRQHICGAPENLADIGTYEQFRHDPEQPWVGLSYTFKADHLPLTPLQRAIARERITIRQSFRVVPNDHDPSDVELRVDINWPTHLTEFCFSLKIDDMPLVVDGRYNGERPEWREVASQTWQTVYGREATTPELDLTLKMISVALATKKDEVRVEDIAGCRFSSALNYAGGWHFLGGKDSGDDGRASLWLRHAMGVSSPTNAHRHSFEVMERLFAALDDLAQKASQALSGVLDGQIYLGPLRSVPESVTSASAHAAGGIHLWEEVLHQESARVTLNEWLRRLDGGDFPPHMTMHHEGDLPTLTPEDRSRLRTALAAVAERLLPEPTHEQNRPSDASDSGPSRLSRDEMLDLWVESVIDAHRKRARILPRLQTPGVTSALPPSQVGIGLSQVIPILAAGATGRNRLILVEQPELHLHPAMQAELGDILIESSAGDDGNTWVIETHSEHLLLRLMRRIRETTRGTLAAGVTPLRAEDVSLCFVEREGGVSRVYPIELDENGMLTRPWPGGFFEEGFREVMAW